jgi:hypothetical protein
MIFRVAFVTVLVVFAGGQARAQAAGGVREVYGAYAGCMDGVAANKAFEPLSASGFFSGVAAGDGRGFVTPAQAGLVGQVQAAAAVCQVALRTRMENLDAGLADLAAQERQLSDVNQLMLFERVEDWRNYVGARERIEGDFWQAAQAAARLPAVETALGADDADVGLDADADAGVN